MEGYVLHCPPLLSLPPLSISRIEICLYRSPRCQLPPRGLGKDPKLKHVQSLSRQVFMVLDSPTQTLRVSYRVKHGDLF